MKKDEEEVVEDSDEEIGFCFEFMGYTIRANKYQYIVSGGTKAGKNKKGEKVEWNAGGYFSTLHHALWDIRNNEMRAATIDSKTLDKAIDRVVELNLRFDKEIAPLKKLELFTNEYHKVN